MSFSWWRVHHMEKLLLFFVVYDFFYSEVRGCEPDAPSSSISLSSLPHVSFVFNKLDTFNLVGRKLSFLAEHMRHL